MEATIEVAAPREVQSKAILAVVTPTIFLSAFLLFWCEPMIGKMLLPMMGGAASVWITCLLFFQLMLLAGYGYAHLLERWASPRAQILVHGALMVAALALLPIAFSRIPDAFASTRPAAWLLVSLFRSAGLPFAIISTTAPLLQNWLSKTKARSGRDPYFLYAVSNAGSLLALLAYPLWIEPSWGVRLQSANWFAGYVLLSAFVLTAAILVWPQLPAFRQALPLTRAFAPTWNDRLFWLAAAFVPSGLMLAVTNHMLLNLASLPFLWVMPLAVYLLTFMIGFARRLRLPLRVMSIVSSVVLIALFPLVSVSRPVASRTLWYLLGAHLLVLFAGALLCHTSLAARRPDASRLTEFYFWVALGGALGGVFVGMVAPFAFASVLEYPLLAAAVAFFIHVRQPQDGIRWSDFVYPAVAAILIAAEWYAFRWAQVDVLTDYPNVLIAHTVLMLFAFLSWRRRIRFGVVMTVLIFGYRLALPGFFDDYQTMREVRNFFGIKKVVFDLDSNARKLLHGDTLHGLESMDPRLSGQPLSYYHETGPVGDIMRLLDTRAEQHVGVVGLGTGTMASWSRPNRHITFFDIDPQVYDVSSRFFTFLRRCAANCDVVIGDGRLSIEKTPDGAFDLLMLDAFNSDSIPAHLVSREAVLMYIRKLKPDGLILFHVSNRYMDVEGLVSAVASSAGLQGLIRYDEGKEAPNKTGSDYVVTARRTEDFGALNQDINWNVMFRPAAIPAWTDDYSNMMAIMRGFNTQ